MPQYSNNDKAQIIYYYDILGYFLLVSGVNFQNHHIKKQVKHNPDTLKYLICAWGCSKGPLWNFCQESMVC